MSEEQKQEAVNKPEEAQEEEKKDAQGQWRTANTWFCTKCGFQMQSYATHAVFCPRCGSRMRPMPCYQ